jgi:hypothetical protein
LSEKLSTVPDFKPGKQIVADIGAMTTGTGFINKV